MDPIYEGVLLKCAEYGISGDNVSILYNLVLEKDPGLKKIKQLIESGEF